MRVRLFLFVGKTILSLQYLRICISAFSLRHTKRVSKFKRMSVKNFKRAFSAEKVQREFLAKKR